MKFDLGDVIPEVNLKERFAGRKWRIQSYLVELLKKWKAVKLQDD